MANKEFKVINIELSDYDSSVIGQVEGKIVCHMDLPDYKITDSVKKNTEIICDALNTYQASNILPSELLQQRNELIDVCQRLLNNELNSNLKMERLIQKITQ